MKMLFADARYRSPTAVTMPKNLVQFCKAYVVGEKSEAPGRLEVNFSTNTMVLALAARSETVPGQMLRLLTQKAQGMIGEHWAWGDPELVFECDLALLGMRGTQYETKLEPSIGVYLPGNVYGPNRLVIETDERALVWLFGAREKEEPSKQIGDKALEARERAALTRAIENTNQQTLRDLVDAIGGPTGIIPPTFPDPGRTI